MEYERVRIIDEETGEETIQLISRVHQPVDIDRQRLPMSSKIRKTTITVRRLRYEYVPIKSESPRQDTLKEPGSLRVPRTRGDTNEFISAFWVNGKPKCRRGYRYDFRRKMCRLIK